MKTLLLPCAIVASGKTTLAVSLARALGPSMAHVQSDDIKAKKPAPIFIRRVIEAFDSHDTVFADKNNHLPQHRSTLTRAFREAYPDGLIVALNWELGGLSRREVIEIAGQRIRDRGEEHQTLTPQKTPEYERIIGMFLRDRVPIDIEENREDALIDHVIYIPYRAREAKVLALVLNFLKRSK
ncbi:MAG: hypothetical protein SGCHY_005052 [Lobulomycetales sp.]